MEYLLQMPAFYKIRVQENIIAVMFILPSVRILIKLAEMNHTFFAGKKAVITQGYQI